GKTQHLSIRQGAKPSFDHFAIGIERFNKDAVIADLRARGATPVDGGDGAGLHVADPDGLFSLSLEQPAEFFARFTHRFRRWRIGRWKLTAPMIRLARIDDRNRMRHV